MKQSHKNNLILFAFIVFGIICISIVYSFINAGNVDSYLTNSDTLYLPSIYLDVFERGNSFLDWSLNGAPNFFPDMVLFMVLSFLSNNIHITIVLFSCVQYALIVFLMYKILQPITKSKTIAIIGFANMLLLLIPLGSLMQSDFEFTFQFLSNSFHLGALLNTLISIWLLQLCLEKNKKLHSILFILVSGLAFISDVLYILFFTAPLLATWFVYSIAEKQKPKKQHLILLFYHGLGIIIGHLIKRSLISFTSIRFAESKAQVSFEAMNDSWQIFTEQFSNYIRYFQLNGILICFLIIGLLISIYLFIKTKTSERLYYLYASIFIVSAVLAPVILGVYLGYDCIRYMFAVFILSPFILAVALNKFLKKEYHVWISQLSLVIIISLFCLINIENKSSNSVDFTNYRSEKINEFNALAKENDLKNGIATYWNAKKITMLNSQNAFIANCFEGLNTYTHVSNKTWWYENPKNNSIMLFDFIIVDNENQKNAALSILGKPKKVIESENLLIFKYDAFYYPQGDYLPKLYNE